MVIFNKAALKKIIGVEKNKATLSHCSLLNSMKSKILTLKSKDLPPCPPKYLLQPTCVAASVFKKKQTKKTTLGHNLPVCPKGNKSVKSEHLGTVTDLCGFQGGRDDKQDSCVHCVDFSMQMDETQNDCSCFCFFSLKHIMHLYLSSFSCLKHCNWVISFLSWSQNGRIRMTGRGTWNHMTHHGEEAGQLGCQRWASHMQQKEWAATSSN